MSALPSVQACSAGTLNDLATPARSVYSQPLSELLRKARCATTAQELNSLLQSAAPAITRISLNALSRFGEIQQVDKEAITQSVFVKVWQNLSALDPLRDPAAWISRTTRNLAVDHLRGLNSKGSLRSNLLDRESLLCPHLEGQARKEYDPARVILDRESEERAQNLKHRFLSSLCPLSREILHLRIEGCSYKEIADTHAIPLSTVRWRLRAIRSQLSGRLDSLGVRASSA